MNQKRSIYVSKRILAVLLVFAMILNSIQLNRILVSAGTDGTSAEYKIVNLNFTEKVALPYTDNSTGVSATISRESESADATADYASGSLKTLNWDGEGKYWQIEFSTKNFKDLTFDAAIRSSSTGPAHFKVAYSTDGTTYTDLTEELTATKSLVPLNSVKLPQLAEDQEKVFIRVYKSADVAINDAAVPSTGVSNINNIVVTGTSIDGTLPEVPEMPMVSKTPAESETPETSETPVISKNSDSQSETVTYYDPVSDKEIPEGAVTIDKAYETADGTNITLVGQIQYKYGKNGSLNTTILEDVIDGKVMGFQIYNAMKDYNVGDVVAVTGTVTTYGNVKQLQKPTDGNITVEKLKEDELIGAQAVTLKQLSENSEDYLSEYVVIKNATLGAYNTANTPITDADGNSLNIYQSAAYPDGLEAGSKANVYGVYSKHNTTYQLRNGKSEDSFKNTGYEVESSVQTQLAKWAGNGQFDGNTVYGDLYAENDFLDTNAKITLSTGNKPQYTNTVNGTTEYYIGSTGLPEGGYYQLEYSSDKYASMELSFKLRSSNSGAKYYNVLYSTDGVNFERADNISYTINTTTYVDGVANNTSKTYTNMNQLEATAAWQSYNVKLSDEAANADKVYVRIQVAEGNSRIDGKASAVSNTYVSRFTSIAVTGSPIISNDICSLVASKPDAGAVALGSEVALSSKTDGASIYYSLNGDEYKVYNEASKPVLKKLPATLTAYAAKEGKEDSVRITYAYTQAQAATVKASPNGGSVKLNSEVKLSCETEGASIFYSLDDGVTYEKYTSKIQVTELPMTIKAYAAVEGYINSEVKTLNFTERKNENYNTYFGQIHSHTSYSDGAGTAKDAFEYASKKADNIDFLAITDHSNYFDNDTSCTITDGSASSEWQEGNQLAEEYTTDKFVGIMGYEMTWSGGAPGHMNTFNTSGFLSRNMKGYGNGSSSSLVNYYAALKTVPDSISQFNHPGTTFGDFYDFAYYDTAIDQLITTIEVGNGEGAIGSTGYFPSYEYYTRALDKGWHVAPTNNQDNHKGYWGNANTARTVVLADSLTRDNIYDALRNMRMYATEDNNLSINYTLNDEVMGTILDETPDSVNIQVDLNDKDTTDKIGKVEVIVNGGLSVASKTITSNTGSAQFTLSPDYSYYYIKVTQADGDIAVTAPVWISDVDAAGVSEVSTTSDLQVQNEAVDIKTEIYNNNNENLEVNSIVYSIGDEIIKTLEGEELAAAGLSTLASQTTGSYTFDFTYDKIGSATVTVTVNASSNGVSKVYSGKLELNYVARDMVSKVLIDGTHFNDYVNGYYAGNITKLAKLAASNYEEVITKTDKITKEDLKDTSLLIITSPAKTSGTTSDNIAYTASHFEDDFINMVADYVKEGGKVMLCGIADYKDSSTTQTSTELNKLLTAMGATTRVNSDEIVDDDNFSNQNYRLYFDDFNKSSKYVDGLVDGMKYSCYSGCSVLLDKESVASGKAEAVVYGHDTTYSIDSKKMDDNYVEVPKGDIVAFAHENVGENGGAVWVGGTVYVSNYDVDEKVKNNTDELSYANTVIVANILAEVQKEMKVTDIAEVRKAGEGEIFTVEGYVTAGTTNIATTFFDTIYIQDDTAGIDIFPISVQGIPIGQKIRITGYVASYQGDKELMVMSYKLLDGSKIYEPKKITTKQATDYDAWGGSLVQVSGTITKVDYAENVLNYIYIQDESGVTCKVLTDGYIGSSTGVDPTETIVKVGNKISASGILYMNPDGVCIRVRDRAEIKLINETVQPVEPQVYKISYYLNGGKNASKNPVSYTAGETVILQAPSKTGYTFDGWYTDSSYKKKLSGNTISSNASGNIAVYAKWTANKYKIQFSKNDSKVSDSMKPVSAVYNKTLKLPASSYKRVGYVFAGWALSADGKVVYRDKASVKNLTSTMDKAVTLYAKWTKVTVDKVKLSSVKAASRTSLKAFYKKVNGAAGYEIVYSKSSSFKNAKTVKVGSGTLSKTLKGLKSDTRYYVKVRAYKKDSAGKKVYGNYSTVKKVSTKKK